MDTVALTFGLFAAITNDHASLLLAAVGMLLPVVSDTIVAMLPDTQSLLHSCTTMCFVCSIAS